MATPSSNLRARTRSGGPPAALPITKPRRGKANVRDNDNDRNDTGGNDNNSDNSDNGDDNNPASANADDVGANDSNRNGEAGKGKSVQGRVTRSKKCVTGDIVAHTLTNLYMLQDFSPAATGGLGGPSARQTQKVRPFAPFFFSLIH